MKPKAIVTNCLVSIALSQTIYHAAEIRTVALSGQQVPGAPEGVNISGFNTRAPALNDLGQTAFMASLTDSGVDSAILSEGSGSLALVARKGDQAPGTASGINYNFFQFGSPLPPLNNVGQTAFKARLTGNGLDSTNNHGIWATDRSGILQLVAR